MIWTLLQRRHFSHPTQSVMREILRKRSLNWFLRKSAFVSWNSRCSSKVGGHPFVVDTSDRRRAYSNGQYQ